MFSTTTSSTFSSSTTTAISSSACCYTNVSGYSYFSGSSLHTTVDSEASAIFVSWVDSSSVISYSTGSICKTGSSTVLGDFSYYSIIFCSSISILSSFLAVISWADSLTFSSIFYDFSIVELLLSSSTIRRGFSSSCDSFSSVGSTWVMTNCCCSVVGSTYYAFTFLGAFGLPSLMMLLWISSA